MLGAGVPVLVGVEDGVVVCGVDGLGAGVVTSCFTAEPGDGWLAGTGRGAGEAGAGAALCWGAGAVAVGVGVVVLDGLLGPLDVGLATGFFTATATVALGGVGLLCVGATTTTVVTVPLSITNAIPNSATFCKVGCRPYRAASVSSF